MTYNELVEKVRKEYSKKDAKNVKEHLAIQFNIFGEGEGAFYVELADGNINVEPYEYFDRDILISTTYDIALKIVSGELDIQEEAYAGRLFAEGRLGKSALLKEIVKKAEKKPAKKTAEKKEAAKPAKKTAEKKPAAKKASVKAAADEAKEAAKKTVGEKKTEEKPAEEKAEEKKA